MGERTRDWIGALWPVFLGLVFVVAAFVTLQGRVTTAQSTADEAKADAKAAKEATQGVREALIDLKRTVEERIPARPR